MNTELIEWLKLKVAAAEQDVRAREQMAATWRSGDAASWAQAAAMHPSTAREKPMSREDRLKCAESQERIALKCKRELQMFRETLAIIDQTQ